uniref:C2 NT-type domain-containing protein n=1 Tax=Cajanus cajan TaxID=3821 RepID=A0A151SQD9_CAJCA|nr:hypothetical protein KK1_003220 [Cajanus cajan]
MVARMMRWRPWPPLLSKKYQVRLIVRTLQGCDLLRQPSGLALEIRWKGPKSTLPSLRRNSVAKNVTREADVRLDHAGAAVLHWDEEFHAFCNFNGYRENVFHPWQIAFTLFNGLNQKLKSKVPAIGTALLNISKFASQTDQKDFDLNIPLALTGGSAESSPLLYISISFVELRAAQESLGSVQRSIVPVASPLAKSGETNLAEKDEVSAIKAGLRKVKILTEYVSSKKAKKGCREEEGSEGRSEDGEYNYPLDSESLDDSEKSDTEEGKQDFSVRKSFSYGTLASANAGGFSYSNTKVNCDDEDLVYYSHRNSDVGCSQVDTVSSSELYLLKSSKRSIIPWRKRKLSFRSPKTNKGEPLLKKAYAEEGGDDIDFDRRQLSSDESLSLTWYKTEDDTSANRSSISEFGDDSFAVGSWEQKEITSRDGYTKLQTQVFFASIDQCSERAAGESACTALVAVIADWFQNNRDHMPIKSQFDSLIREGSSEWRNLCDNDTYRERFPDKHFDLETIIQAKVHDKTPNDQKTVVEALDHNNRQTQQVDHNAGEEEQLRSEQEEVICRGKEACKEYIKSFLAAIPIRELEADAKKGLISSASLYHRLLQVEFHYTQLLQSCFATPVNESSMVAPESFCSFNN